MTVNPSLAIGFAERHPTAAARAIEQIARGDAARFLGGLPAARAAAVVAEMAVPSAAAAVQDMDTAHAAAILRAMAFQPAVRLLRSLDGARRDTLLAHFPSARARQVVHALQLPPGSVGAWTDATQPAFSPERRVQECIDILRSSRARAPEAVFVVDASRTVIGELHLIDLLRAPRDAHLDDIAWAAPATIPAAMPVANAALDERWPDRTVLAAVARSGELVGGFSHRDLLRALAAMAGERLRGPQSEPLWTGLIGAYIATVTGLTDSLFTDETGRGS